MILKLTKKEIELLLGCISDTQSEFEGTEVFEKIKYPLSKLQDKLEKFIKKINE